jgi:DNA-binding MarR family transcriptional regulator
MPETNDELLTLVREIRNLLVPISACFEERFAEIQKQRWRPKREAFKAILTPTRRAIYPLLFDPRNLSQIEIAKELGISQPAVSRFVGMLQEQDLIDQSRDQAGKIAYIDKYNLVELLNETDGEE